MNNPAVERRRKPEEPYALDDQVGFVLRQAQQRHTTIFAAEMIEGVTPTQWAALAKLRECGASSQNHLGRLTAMDAATIKGVIDRLTGRGVTATRPDPDDARRLVVDLTAAGDGTGSAKLQYDTWDGVDRYTAIEHIPGSQLFAVGIGHAHVEHDRRGQQAFFAQLG